MFSKIYEYVFSIPLSFLKGHEGLFTAVFVSYLAVVRYYRYQNLDYIRTKYPDPSVLLTDSKAAKEVFSITAHKEFVYIIQKSLDMAVFKTLAPPAGAKLLYATREFADNVDRRMEDTNIIVTEFSESYSRVQNMLKKNPNASQEEIDEQYTRAEKSMKRLNQLHGKYNIDNKDFLQTYCLFVAEPIRWINKHGYRKLDIREEYAMYRVWTDMAIAMNLQDIPKDIAEIEDFMEKYTEADISYHSASWKVGGPLLRITLNQHLPWIFKDLEFFYRLGIKALPTFLTPQEVEAFGLQVKESPLITSTINTLFQVSGFIQRHMKLPRSDYATFTSFAKNKDRKYKTTTCFFDQSRSKNGYLIEELGPAKFLLSQHQKQLLDKSSDLSSIGGDSDSESISAIPAMGCPMGGIRSKQV